MKTIAAGITIGILLVPAFGGGLIQSKTPFGAPEAPGVTDINPAFFFRSIVTDSGALNCTLEVEVQAIGVPFTNTPNVLGNTVASGLTSQAAFTAGTSLAVAGYHWQARVANSAAVVTAFQSFGANPEADADFTIDLRPPQPVNINQQPVIGTNAPPGSYETNAQMLFVGLVTDPDAENYFLQVEIAAVGSAFTGTPSFTSLSTASGTNGVIFANLAPTFPAGSYHWRARSRNVLLHASDWVSFGANLETDADFIEGLPDPVNLKQSMISATLPMPANPVGSMDTNAQVRFAATWTDPEPFGNYDVQIEIKPVGTPFNGIVTGSSGSTSSGTQAEVAIVNPVLTTQTGFHWRARVHTFPLNYLSNWISFGANLESDADFIESAGDPFNLKQSMNSTTLPMPANPVGSMDTNAQVRFAATYTDPEGLGSYELQIEIRAVGTAFNGTPTQVGGTVASGAQAELVISNPVLGTQTGYHWRARIRALSFNFLSNWVSFGANLESDADFIESAGDPFNLKQAMNSSTLPMPSNAVGSMDTNAVVRFGATYTDPEAFGSYELQIEVKTVGTALTGTPTQVGGVAVSGVQAEQVSASLLPTQTGHHWRARIRTMPLNFLSNWISFGANLETDADFFEDVTGPFNLKQAMNGATSPMPANPVGSVDTNGAVRFAATYTDPEGLGSYELQIEVQPLSAAFTGAPTQLAGIVSSSLQAELLISNPILTTQAGYHWRARIRTIPSNYLSNWVSFGANLETDADFLEGVPDPFNLKQGMNSATAPMPADPVGSTDPDADVRFGATYTDPEGLGTFELQIEVKPVGTALTGTPTQVAAAAASGAQAELIINGAPIAAEAGYHWAARIRSIGLNYLSSWASFGGNSETGTDFFVGGTPIAPTPVQSGTSLGAAQPVGYVDVDGTLFLRSVVVTTAGFGNIVLEVEVQPVGTAFTGTANGFSPSTPSGGTAEVSVTPLIDGAYRWRARAVAAGGASSWIEFGANPSSDADFLRDGAEPTSSVTTTGIRNVVTYGGMIIGSAADVTSGVILVEITLQRTSDAQFWNGTAFQPTPIFVSATGTTTWSFAFGATDGESYSIQSRATDAGGIVETTLGTGAFTFDMTLPVSIPTTSGTISSSVYPGAVQGTATDAVGLLSVSVSIRDAGTGLYWNGAIFAAGPLFIPATGTVAWSVPFAAASGVVYDVQSRAIDLAGNVQGVLGQSTFTVDATGPDSVITTSGIFSTATFPGAINGTASTAVGATVTLVEITIQRASDGFFFDGATFVAGSTFLATTGTTTWTFAFLPGVDTYTVNSRATDSTATIETSFGLATFTVASSLPVSTITTTGIFVLATWPGAVQGTASGGSGGIVSVEVALQRTSDGFFWNGTDWQAAQIFVPVTTGTATWALTFVPSTGESYTVFARATDGAAIVEAPPATGFFAFVGDSGTGGGGGGTASSRSRARCSISAGGAPAIWLLVFALLPLLLRKRP